MKPLNVRQKRRAWERWLRSPQQVVAGVVTIDNFQLFWEGTDGDASRVANGQIGGITPTLNGGDALDHVPPPTIDLSAAASGILKVYAKVTTTHTDEDGWVISTVVSGVDILAGASVPDDNLTTEYYITLATVTSGVVVTPQPIRNSLALSFTPYGPGESKATMYTWPVS